MVYACMNCAMTRTEIPKQTRRRLSGALRVIGLGALRMIGAHDAHDRFEGPKGTIGFVARAEDA